MPHPQIDVQILWFSKTNETAIILQQLKKRVFFYLYWWVQWTIKCTILKEHSDSVCLWSICSNQSGGENIVLISIMTTKNFIASFERTFTIFYINVCQRFFIPCLILEIFWLVMKATELSAILIGLWKICMLRQKWGHASFSFHLDSSLKLVLGCYFKSRIE